VSRSEAAAAPWGLIAGNGRFPLLVLQAARSQGLKMQVAAIREETWPEIAEQGYPVTWMNLGQLGKLIECFQAAGVRQAIMAGQVQHKQIFTALRPDWKMVKVLATLATRSTNSLLGAVIETLAAEGIEVVDSRRLLEPLLAGRGALTQRSPDAREQADIAYGWKLARLIAGADIGQTVAISGCACVAVEAMEGTDAVIRRAAELTAGQPLTIVKVARPRQDVRYDVPVIGVETIAALEAAGATALAVESGLTLLLDRAELLARADAAGIALWGQAGEAAEARP
jgi:DUF1009 family protein